ncbi:MAG: hypothetical protein ACTJGQ_06950 [Agrococcus casei]|uniref:hypothetical protein n=1 Tax=Agrococcus casei TaxID=343512 RepID=UPI003F8DC2FF
MTVPHTAQQQPTRPSAGTGIAFFAALAAAGGGVLAAFFAAITVTLIANPPAMEAVRLFTSYGTRIVLVLLLALVVFRYRAAHVTAIVLSAVFLLLTFGTMVAQVLLPGSAEVPVVGLYGACFLLSGGAALYALRAARQQTAEVPRLPFILALGAVVLCVLLDIASPVLRIGFEAVASHPVSILLPTLLPVIGMTLVVTFAAFGSRISRITAMVIAVVFALVELMQAILSLPPGTTVIQGPGHLLQGVGMLVAAGLLLWSSMAMRRASTPQRLS